MPGEAKKKQKLNGIGKGTPGPGRPKGSKSKQTLMVEARLAALGCDPIRGMADLAMDEDLPPELRGKMYSELAKYIAPQRKAIDHGITQEAPTITVVSRVPKDPVPELESGEDDDPRVIQ